MLIFRGVPTNIESFFLSVELYYSMIICRFAVSIPQRKNRFDGQQNVPQSENLAAHVDGVNFGPPNHFPYEELAYPISKPMCSKENVTPTNHPTYSHHVDRCFWVSLLRLTINDISEASIYTSSMWPICILYLHTDVNTITSAFVFLNSNMKI